MADEEGNGRGFLFLVGLISSCLAVVLNVISFCTPYWWVSKDPVSSQFEKIGLWEACFHGYAHLQDYLSKTFYGCWWIFHREYRNVFDWLAPSWFITVQVLSTITMVCLIIGCMILVLYYVKCCQGISTKRVTLSASGLMLFAGVLETIVVIIFGVKGDDRVWLPRPDLNYYSWSYALAVLSGFFAYISAFFLLMEVFQHAPKKNRRTEGEFAMGTVDYPTKRDYDY